MVVPEGLSFVRTVLRGEAGESLVLRTNDRREGDADGAAGVLRYKSGK